MTSAVAAARRALEASSAAATAVSGAVGRAYRASGADLPYGDPLPAHDVAMEGYFWRFTDPATGRVLIALEGVNRGPRGHWATLGLASHPTGLLRTRAHPVAHASTTGLGVSAGDAFRGSLDRLRVDLGPGARLDVSVGRPVWATPGCPRSGRT